MHTIYLIRHGESQGNAAAAGHDVPRFGGRKNELDLTECGIDQAGTLGRYAQKHDIRPRLAYCSPAVRSIKTHLISASAMNSSLDCIIDNRLQELDWGNWTDQPRSVMDQPAVKRERVRLGRDFQPPGGESTNMVLARMMGFLHDLVADNPSGTYWVHSHRNAIKAVIGHFMDWSAEEITENDLATVSLTKLTCAYGQFDLDFYNRATISLSIH